MTVPREEARPNLLRKFIDAFRGSVVPGAAGPRPGRDQVGTHVMDPSRVWPVRTSRYGASSSRALQVIQNLPEYANFRRPLSGEIFVADPKNYNRVVRRRMGAPPIVGALTPSTASKYRAPMYVGIPADEIGQVMRERNQPVTPAHRMLGGR